MITLRSPLSARNDIWESQVNIKTLTPARRAKLILLLDSVGFVLKSPDGKEVEGEVVDDAGVYKIEAG